MENSGPILISILSQHDATRLMVRDTTINMHWLENKTKEEIQDIITLASILMNENYPRMPSSIDLTDAQILGLLLDNAIPERLIKQTKDKIDHPIHPTLHNHLNGAEITKMMEKIKCTG